MDVNLQATLYNEQGDGREGIVLTSAEDIDTLQQMSSLMTDFLAGLGFGVVDVGFKYRDGDVIWGDVFK